MFQLIKEEAELSRSQIVILNRGSNIEYLPYVVTEQGVAMLSSVLTSSQAVMVNIRIGFTTNDPVLTGSPHSSEKP